MITHLLLVGLFIQVGFIPGFSLIEKYAKPEIVEAYKDVLSNGILERNDLTQEEFCLVAAIGFVETRYRPNIRGSHGEIGIMQVIPWNLHIKEMLDDLPCYTKNCKFRNMKQYMLADPRHQIEAGVAELGFWKKQYRERYQKKYWSRFPWWHLRKRFEDRYRTYRIWKKYKSWFGDWIYVIHYNSGPRIVTFRYVRKIKKALEEAGCVSYIPRKEE